MYESFWKMSAKPFCYRTETADLYRCRSIQSASLRLQYCFDNNASAALLLGASGVGKSSLLQQLKHENQQLMPFAHVAFPTLSATELMRMVAAEILPKAVQQSTPADQLLSEIHQALRETSGEGYHAVVAFDEAHLLSNDHLNQTVLPLLNLADTDHDLKLTVVLSGQPVLASHVARNGQLRERVAVTATMDRFTDNEVKDYISTRLNLAGVRQEIFTDDAVIAITDLSEGNPRRINRLCDMALLVGYADQISMIGASEVRSLSVELLPAAA